MSNRNDAVSWLTPAALAVALVGTLVAITPQPADAGKVDAPPQALPPEREAAATDGTYQLRCWQYGRLLFEERALVLATDMVEGLKLSGTDRRRQPVLVTDTGNATCLIRRAPAPRKPYP
jgi:hypothetical protein